VNGVRPEEGLGRAASHQTSASSRHSVSGRALGGGFAGKGRGAGRGSGGKSGGERGEEGARSALNVRFDVALHVRTINDCVEEGGEEGDCRAGGVQKSFQSLRESPELLRFVTTEQWHCVARALALLLQLKREKAQRGSQGGRGGVRWRGVGGGRRDSDSDIESLYSTVPGLFRGDRGQNRPEMLFEGIPCTSLG